MNRNSFRAATSKMLEAVTVTLVVILMLALGAVARTYETLYKFTGGADGNHPWAALIFDTAGNLYGTTYSGGDYGAGTAFKLTPNGDGTWTETVLHSFGEGDDGASPAAPLVSDEDGNLYGTTNGGGNYGYGCVFEMKPNPDGSWSETTLYSFTGGTDGTYPVGGVSFDAAGKLYGMTTTGGNGKCSYLGNTGCGTVYMLAPNPDGTWTESVLHRFNGGANGGYPDQGNPILDSAGNLYGVTRNGGLSGPCDWGDCGVVFRLTPNSDGSWTEKVLHRFTGADGGNPESKVHLIFDDAGSLYGTTLNGGLYGCGVVFKLTPSSSDKWTRRVLHHFTGGKDGGNPYAGLIFDAGGNLYGVTIAGGTHGYGVAFEMTPGAGGRWGEHVLHAFADNPGAYPGPSVIFDTAGNLYGITGGDLYETFGSVFEITP